MVAFPGYPCHHDDRGVNRVFRRQRCRAVYLHPVLTEVLMKNLNTREKDLETISVLAAASLVCFLVFRKIVFIFAAFGLLFLGLVFKNTASKASAVWLTFSRLLGGFNTRVILSLTYFIILTPIAIVFRLFTKKHVNSPRVTFGKSYFITREHLFVASDFEKVW